MSALRRRWCGQAEGGVAAVRMLSISLLLIATSASAQSPPSVDCDAVKNSVAPVELAYHGQDGTKMVAQAYRDNYVWLRDFENEELLVSNDLFEVVRAFCDCRPSA